MPLWTKDTPPVFFKNAVQTKAGWVNPDTGEILVAISDLTSKSGAANIIKCAFESAVLQQLDPLNVIVRFAERVDVTAGATIDVTSTGSSGIITLTAAAQLGVYDVLFEGTVPPEPAVLAIPAQSLVGTIQDDDGGAPAELAISGTVAAAAGSRTVV